MRCECSLRCSVFGRVTVPDAGRMLYANPSDWIDMLYRDLDCNVINYIKPAMQSLSYWHFYLACMTLTCFVILYFQIYRTSCGSDSIVQGAHVWIRSRLRPSRNADAANPRVRRSGPACRSCPTWDECAENIQRWYTGCLAKDEGKISIEVTNRCFCYKIKISAHGWEICPHIYWGHAIGLYARRYANIKYEGFILYCDMFTL